MTLDREDYAEAWAKAEALEDSFGSSLLQGAQFFHESHIDLVLLDCPYLQQKLYFLLVQKSLLINYSFT